MGFDADVVSDVAPLNLLIAAMLGVSLEWIELRDFLPSTRDGTDWSDPRLRRSALASSFVATLELARIGKAQIAQEETFGPLRVRAVKA